PGRPSWTMHQPGPGVARRRVSQPSIHLPRSVYLSGMNTAASGLRRFSFSAKNSSLAATARPPRRADARSMRWVNSLIEKTETEATEITGHVLPRRHGETENH